MTTAASSCVAASGSGRMAGPDALGKGREHVRVNRIRLGQPPERLGQRPDLARIDHDHGEAGQHTGRHTRALVAARRFEDHQGRLPVTQRRDQGGQSVRCRGKRRRRGLAGDGHHHRILRDIESESNTRAPYDLLHAAPGTPPYEASSRLRRSFRVSRCQTPDEGPELGHGLTRPSALRQLVRGRHLVWPGRLGRCSPASRRAAPRRPAGAGFGLDPGSAPAPRDGHPRRVEPSSTYKALPNGQLPTELVRRREPNKSWEIGVWRLGAGRPLGVGCWECLGPLVPWSFGSSAPPVGGRRPPTGDAGRRPSCRGSGARDRRARRAAPSADATPNWRKKSSCPATASTHSAGSTLQQLRHVRVATISPAIDRVQRRHGADRRCRRPRRCPSHRSRIHLQHAHVLAEAGPEELAVLVGAEPVDVEDLAAGSSLRAASSSQCWK